MSFHLFFLSFKLSCLIREPIFKPVDNMSNFKPRFFPNFKPLHDVCRCSSVNHNILLLDMYWISECQHKYIKLSWLLNCLQTTNLSKTIDDVCQTTHLSLSWNVRINSEVFSFYAQVVTHFCLCIWSKIFIQHNQTCSSLKEQSTVIWRVFFHLQFYQCSLLESALPYHLANFFETHLLAIIHTLQFNLPILNYLSTCNLYI